MAVKNKDEFQSKYGAPTSPDAQVLIGMKSGRAVYGSELDATDTKGSNVINNTPSQNQAIMNDMFKEMGRSGGMYNPSSKDIVAAERMSPITAADRNVTRRADGKELIGAESQQAANMRESPNADARFLQTLSRLNARPDRTSATEPTQTPPPDLPKIAKESRAREASPFTTGPAPLPAPLGSGSNVLLANDSLEQTGGPNNAAATIPPLFGGEVPTDADILKELRRKAMRGPTLEMRKEDSEFSNRFGPTLEITADRSF
jgi:hypothetical protein